MSDLHSPSSWRRRLGYLPIPLFGLPDERRFVLLNGTTGNFCLDVAQEDSPPERRNSCAWSTDVDHYVRIETSRVYVSRWDRAGVEQYSLQDLDGNLESFQEYLERDRAPKERSVTAHAIRVYRRLRSAWHGSGNEALLAFLTLLWRAWDTTHTPVGTTQWPDYEAGLAALQHLSKQQQSALLDELTATTAPDNNTPDFRLILRHAAGRIFQEAHYLVDVSPQLDFDGLSEAVPIGPMTRSSGAYFTPTPLVRTLVEQALQRTNIHKAALTFFDPACGSGEFLRETLRQLHQREFAGRVNLVGFDVSEAACQMARFALCFEKIDWGQRLTFSVEQRDSMSSEPWPVNVDGCLMNPPYVSWEKLGLEQRENLTAELGDLYQRRPDLSSIFLLRAAQSLGADGILGAILPASSLDGKSAAPIRSALSETVDLRMLARLGDQTVFSNAVVDPSLLVATKRPSSGSSDTMMLWADHRPRSSAAALRDLRKLTEDDGTPAVAVEKNGFSIYTVPQSSLSPDSWAPRALASYRLLQQLSRLKTVQSYFKVHQGLITGLNTAFLLADDAVNRLPRRERAYFRPAVVNDSIKNGQLRANWYVFHPYAVDGSGLSLTSEEELKAAVPTYFDSHLLPQKARLLQRVRIQRDRWWRLSEYRSWQASITPRLFSTYFGQHGSFAFDASGQFLVVQGYSWEAKRPGALDDLMGDAIVALLAAPATDKLLAAVSNNVAGGQWNLSSRFMAQMPFPNLWRPADRSLIESLAQAGAGLRDGSAVSHDVLNALWTRAYDLDTTEVLAL